MRILKRMRRNDQDAVVSLQSEFCVGSCSFLVVKTFYLQPVCVCVSQSCPTALCVCVCVSDRTVQEVQQPSSGTVQPHLSLLFVCSILLFVMSGGKKKKSSFRPAWPGSPAHFLVSASADSLPDGNIFQAHLIPARLRALLLLTTEETWCP